jgi:hypothetical protein
MTSLSAQQTLICPSILVGIGTIHHLYQRYSLLIYEDLHLRAGSLPASIHNFLAKHGNGGRKSGNVKVNETSTTPNTLTIADNTHFLNKGKIVTFQGHQCFTSSTKTHYHDSQNGWESHTMALTGTHKKILMALFHQHCLVRSRVCCYTNKWNNLKQRLRARLLVTRLLVKYLNEQLWDTSWLP